jgi:hypothetical protein
MPSVSGRCELSLSIVRAAGVHLNRAKEEVTRMEKELHEIRSSRVQLLPPSAWIKREHKYKMDLEKYEHTITMQAARLKEMEEQVAVLMAGDNIKPLEERIAVSDTAGSSSTMFMEGCDEWSWACCMCWACCGRHTRGHSDVHLAACTSCSVCRPSSDSKAERCRHHG